MKLKKMHWFGIIFGGIAFLVDIIFFFNDNDKNLFSFLMAISITIVCLPFVIDIMIENKREQEISEMFLEFTRNLAESVNTGTPISKSIINMKKKNYGSLNPYVEKLSNQIALGIPVQEALENFSYDVGNPVIQRAIVLIKEAERAGGEIDYILDSVAKSISEVEKLKNERKSAISNLVVQGYLIFFIFIGIMLVVEYKILPLTSGIGTIGSFDINQLATGPIGTAAPSNQLTPEQIASSFLYLLIVQGFFAGITIGKLTEGSLKAGIKHSFILAITAFLVATGAKLFLGTPGAGAV